VHVDVEFYLSGAQKQKEDSLSLLLGEKKCVRVKVKDSQRERERERVDSFWRLRLVDGNFVFSSSSLLSADATTSTQRRRNI